VQEDGLDTLVVEVGVEAAALLVARATDNETLQKKKWKKYLCNKNELCHLKKGKENFSKSVHS
jgi:hypothetical protein